ncbi:hypothetical protein MKEN_00868900 [Mycena kentingensis (nom. inval.)]|nr:hypothetical protein MKEN_00868900 [Mycena kentingensis (nom. inval.)]
MSGEPQHQAIDDTSPAIQYSGSWTAASPADLDGFGNGNGRVLNGTAMKTVVDGSFKLRFNGTAVAVYGSMNTTTLDGTVTPSWTCLVDGLGIVNQPVVNLLNNKILCNGSDLSADREHELSVNIKTSGQPFIFDYVLYVPSPTQRTVAGPSVVVFTDADKSNVTFSGTWNQFKGGTATHGTGAQMIFNFAGGSSVELWGKLPDDSTGETRGTYALDGGSTVAFTIPASGTSVQDHQSFFHTPRFPAGSTGGNTPHQIIVTYEGTMETSALILDQFNVYFDSQPDRPSTSVVTSISSSAVPTRSSSPIPNPSPKANAGTIAGAVVGTLVAAGFLAIAALLICRRRRRTRVTTKQEAQLQQYTPFRETGFVYPPAASSEPSLASASMPLTPHRRNAAASRGPSSTGSGSASGSGGGSGSGTGSRAYPTSSRGSPWTSFSGQPFSQLEIPQPQSKFAEAQPAEVQRVNSVVRQHEDSGIRVVPSVVSTPSFSILLAGGRPKVWVSEGYGLMEADQKRQYVDPLIQ